MGNCKGCFRFLNKIPDCLTSLSIMTSILNDVVQIKITDKFNNYYYREVTTEPNGLAVLDISDASIYPSGLINAYSGEFVLTIFKGGVIVPFIVENIGYDCLFFEATTTFPKETTYTIDVYGNESGGY